VLVSPSFAAGFNGLRLSAHLSILSAGVWHNVLLSVVCLVLLALFPSWLSSHGFTRVPPGALIVETDPSLMYASSAMQPGWLLTHVDDVQVRSTADAARVFAHMTASQLMEDVYGARGGYCFPRQVWSQMQAKDSECCVERQFGTHGKHACVVREEQQLPSACIDVQAHFARYAPVRCQLAKGFLYTTPRGPRPWPAAADNSNRSLPAPVPAVPAADCVLQPWPSDRDAATGARAAAAAAPMSGESDGICLHVDAVGWMNPVANRVGPVPDRFVLLRTLPASLECREELAHGEQGRVLHGAANCTRTALRILTAFDLQESLRLDRHARVAWWPAAGVQPVAYKARYGDEGMTLLDRSSSSSSSGGRMLDAQLHWPHQVSTGLSALSAVSLLMALLNSMPIPWLDGGKAVGALQQAHAARSAASAAVPLVLSVLFALLLAANVAIGVYANLQWQALQRHEESYTVY